MKYLPLAFVSTAEEPGKFFDSSKEIFKREGLIQEEYTEKEFLDYVFSDTFLKPSYRGKFELLNHRMTEAPYIRAFLRMSPSDLRNPDISLTTEWRDMLSIGIITDRWSLNKQVYKLDKEFAHALENTDRLIISKNAVKHLPCNPFYVDLEDCPQYGTIKGAYVYVYQKDDFCQIAIYMLRGDLLVFSYYNEGYFNADGLIEGDADIMPSVNYVSPLVFETLKPEQLQTGYMPKDKVAKLIMQFINYLGSAKPDVEENPHTKSTYRPSKTVRNKFSEIRQWDVGVRYGKSIRALSEKKTYDRKESKEENKEVKERKPVRPHYRCAHWHRYWTGQGRTKLEFKWLEPTLVGVGETDVVIHSVK
jgi:hypothetical protein